MEQCDDNATVQDLKTSVRDFIRNRDWEKYHTARNLAESISIEASELLKLFQWSLDKEDESKVLEQLVSKKTKDENKPNRKGRPGNQEKRLYPQRGVLDSYQTRQL